MLQITGLEKLKEAHQNESTSRRCKIAVGQAIHALLALGLGITFIFWWSNASQIQEAYDNFCDRTNCRLPDLVFYDVAFYNGRFSDIDQAQEYAEELREDCSEDCFKDGCRWSIIYKFCAMTLILIAFNGIFMTLGAWNIQTRAISGCCCCLLGIVNLAAMITTCIFRFNTMGKLAALSQQGSKYDGGPDNIDIVGKKVMLVAFLSNEQTYEDDGTIIIILWVGQIILCLSHCCVMGYVSKPPVVNHPETDAQKAGENSSMNLIDPKTGYSQVAYPGTNAYYNPAGNSTGNFTNTTFNTNTSTVTGLPMNTSANDSIGY